MIDKQEFYHGAALMRVVEDSRCQSISKDQFGFLVNGQNFIYLKYTTKGRTPWRFQFTADEVNYLNQISAGKVVIALVCGGDGICGIEWKEALRLMGNSAGWISCARHFNEQYGIAGSQEKLKGKITLQNWPNLIFNN